MKFGTTVWTYQWRPPYDDTLRWIAGLGFRAVELIAWNREALDTYYTLATIKALRAGILNLTISPRISLICESPN